VDAGTDVSTIGPMQLIAVGFAPGVGFVGTIIQEIDRLQGHGVLRLVDLVVLTMDDNGSLTRVEIADEDFGDLLIADAQLDPADVFAMFEGRGVHVLQSERAQALAQSLVPGSGLALVLVEHRWARSLFDSIADLGGVVFSEGFIGERAEELVSVQLAALEDTARVIDAAYAAQTEAERRVCGGDRCRSPESRRGGGGRLHHGGRVASPALLADQDDLRAGGRQAWDLALCRQRTRRAGLQEAGCAQSRRCGRPCSRTRIDQTRGLKAASFSILHWRDGLSPAIRQPSLELGPHLRERAAPPASITRPATGAVMRDVRLPNPRPRRGSP
jgi:hypothetical protein